MIYGLVLGAGTVWAFIAARRRELMATQTASMAGAVWAVATALLVVDFHLHDGRALPVQILIIGLAALALAPLALTPLAVAWNRHR